MRWISDLSSLFLSPLTFLSPIASTTLSHALRPKVMSHRNPKKDRGEFRSPSKKEEEEEELKTPSQTGLAALNTSDDIIQPILVAQPVVSVNVTASPPPLVVQSSSRDSTPPSSQPPSPRSIVLMAAKARPPPVPPAGTSHISSNTNSPKYGQRNMHYHNHSVVLPAEGFTPVRAPPPAPSSVSKVAAVAAPIGSHQLPPPAAAVANIPCSPTNAGSIAGVNTSALVSSEDGNELQQTAAAAPACARLDSIGFKLFGPGGANNELVNKLKKRDNNNDAGTPTSASSSAAYTSVPACTTSGCTCKDFVLDSFRKGKCRNCFHVHV